MERIVSLIVAAIKYAIINVPINNQSNLITR